MRSDPTGDATPDHLTGDPTPVPVPADGRAAVVVEGLGVTYRSGRSRVVALDGIDLTIPHGRAFGVIGANGAGKTTLLRTLAGIIPPTAGRVSIDGDVTAVLSLDVGISPELTGTENILLGCLARGLTRAEARARTPAIAAFAGLADAVDRPLRTYSSGMRARLAFAIAVEVEPDILLLDEALATGDAAFRATSAGRMRQLVADASTIVLVSHSLKSVSDLCEEVAWLADGRIRQIGSANEVVRAYRRHVAAG